VSFELPKISEPVTATQLRQPVLMQLTLMAAGNGKPPAKLRTGATSEPRLEAEPLARQGQDSGRGCMRAACPAPKDGGAPT
jgi:hypothetical protein